MGGISEREGVNVNVEGGVRIGEPFVVGDEEIKVREYERRGLGTGGTEWFV